MSQYSNGRGRKSQDQVSGQVLSSICFSVSDLGVNCLIFDRCSKREISVKERRFKNFPRRGPSVSPVQRVTNVIRSLYRNQSSTLWTLNEQQVVSPFLLEHKVVSFFLSQIKQNLLLYLEMKPPTKKGKRERYQTLV